MVYSTRHLCSVLTLPRVHYSSDEFPCRYPEDPFLVRYREPFVRPLGRYHYADALVDRNLPMYDWSYKYNNYWPVPDVRYEYDDGVPLGRDFAVRYRDHHHFEGRLWDNITSFPYYYFK